MEEITEIAKIIKILLSDQIDKSVWVELDAKLDTIIERYESAKACRDRCLNAAATCDKTEETVREGGRPDEGGMGDREEEDRSSSTESRQGSEGH